MPKTPRSPEHAHLLALLIERRKAAGLTQQALADRLGQPQSYVAKIKNGARRVDVVEFVALARGMRLDPMELLRRYLAIAGNREAARRELRS